jgi:hypothetical protein
VELRGALGLRGGHGVLVPVTFWLGPYAVIRGRSCKKGNKSWQIVSRSGQVVKVGVPYKRDADEACRVLNLGAKVTKGSCSG